MVLPWHPAARRLALPTGGGVDQNQGAASAYPRLPAAEDNQLLGLHVVAARELAPEGHLAKPTAHILVLPTDCLVYLRRPA
jgi:hypothetical protein